MTFSPGEMSSIIFLMISYLPFPLSLLFLNIYYCISDFLDCFLNFLSPLTYFLYFFKSIYLFYLFHFCLCWVFVAVHRLSLVAASGGYSWLRCAGFSLQWLLLLRSMGLGVQAAVGLVRGL